MYNYLSMGVILPSLQQVDLASGSALSAYLKKLAAFCPFIEPSANARCLYACEATPDLHAAQDIHPRLFEQLVPLIERFRDARKSLAEKEQKLLICHTVILRISTPLDADAVRLLNWPNWLGLLLRQLYTPKEIVFGFIRKNVVEKSSVGGTICAAPFHAVVIRSRVVGSDHRFFQSNQPMLQAMMEAEDDGADVHAPLLGNVPDIRDPQAMRDAGYFQRVRQWGQKTLSKP